MAGCASLSIPTGQLLWKCDPAADGSVARHDWQEAAAAHERLLEREPRNGLALYHLGYIAGKLGNREAEIEYYRNAIACGYDRDDQLFFNLGMAHGDLDPATAMHAFERALTLNPGNADNFFGLALMADTLGQTDKAVQSLNTALQVQPDHLDAMLLLARINMDQSLWQNAAALLDRVLGQDPDNEEAQELSETLRFRQRIQYDAPDAEEPLAGGRSR